MNSTICSHCRLALRRTINSTRRQTTASQSTVTAASLTRPSQSSQPIDNTPHDLASLLSKPTWSVRSLLPPSDQPPTPAQQTTTKITPQTLHHLLRLSALPLPKTPDEETQMLATLSSQLHFVRAIQNVNTTGVAPLRVIRDETAQGLREQTIGLAELREALGAEDVVGHAKRPQRRRRGKPQESGTEQTRSSSSGEEVGGGGGGGREQVIVPRQTQERGVEQERVPNDEEDWDVLAGASETAGGRYFVVRSSSGTSSLPNGQAN